MKQCLKLTSRIRFVFFVSLICWLLTSCGPNDSSSTDSENSQCSIEQLESEMTEQLSGAPSSVDFSVTLERSDGRNYQYLRGSSTFQTPYESASTSKLVSAVIILRLIEQGHLDLADSPQDHIPTWPIIASDSLFNINLSQLLSFTSGLTDEPFCLNIGLSNFENCVENIGTENQGNGNNPGEAFYYSGTHLQVAGLMAIEALNVSSWQDVFTLFQSETGLFPNSEYDLPSSSNPRLAGGMHWTGDDYLTFLRALKKW